MQQIIHRETTNRRFGVEIEVRNNIAKNQISDALSEFEQDKLILDGAKSHTVEATIGDEGWAQTVNNDFWHVKFDRSCGWEVASFIGSGLSDVRHVATAAFVLKRIGCKADHKCGLHVHAETADYTPEDMGRLLAYWLKVETALMSICTETRKNNKYCRPLKKRLNDVGLVDLKWNWKRLFTFYELDEVRLNPIKLWDILKPTDFSIHNNPQRRYALNVMGFAQKQEIPTYSRNTAELRLPECVLNKEHVEHWTKLFINLVSTARTKPMPDKLDCALNLKELLWCLGLEGGNDFLVLEPELQETKVWFLRKLAMQSELLTLRSEASKQLDFITIL